MLRAEDYPGITAFETDSIQRIWASSQQAPSSKPTVASMFPISDSPEFNRCETIAQAPSDHALIVAQAFNSPSFRKMERDFLNIEGVEVEVCKDLRTQKRYIRHHLYWKLIYNRMNPDFDHNCVETNLKQVTNQQLSTIRWVGYDFHIERVMFVEDGMEVDVILLPLAMFEDLMRYWNQYHRQNGTQTDNDPMKLGQWLEQNTIAQLLPN
jgi:hypothetical protein